MKQRLGLWLTRRALSRIGNRDLSTLIEVVPLIPERRLARSRATWPTNGAGRILTSLYGIDMYLVFTQKLPTVAKWLRV